MIEKDTRVDLIEFTFFGHPIHMEDVEQLLSERGETVVIYERDGNAQATVGYGEKISGSMVTGMGSPQTIEHIKEELYDPNSPFHLHVETSVLVEQGGVDPIIIFSN